MGPIWGRQDPGGHHVDPINFAILVCTQDSQFKWYTWWHILGACALSPILNTIFFAQQNTVLSVFRCCYTHTIYLWCLLQVEHLCYTKTPLSFMRNLFEILPQCNAFGNIWYGHSLGFIAIRSYSAADCFKIMTKLDACLWYWYTEWGRDKMATVFRGWYFQIRYLQ